MIYKSQPMVIALGDLDVCAVAGNCQGQGLRALEFRLSSYPYSRPVAVEEWQAMIPMVSFVVKDIKDVQWLKNQVYDLERLFDSTSVETPEE